MGQQQLLLLVLGAIIVGAAIVVGINMFSSNAFQANVDAVRQDCLTIASRLQEFWRKPVTLGGGGHDFQTVTGFEVIGYDTTGLAYANEHGEYSITAATSATTIDIVGKTKEKNNKSESLVVTYTLNPSRVELTDEKYE